MKNFPLFLFFLLFYPMTNLCTSADDTVKVDPVPEGETLYEKYTVRINGQKVPVYRARVSAVPLNWRWPGYQRPLYQTEFAGFCYWDMAEPVTLEVNGMHHALHLFANPMETSPPDPDDPDILYFGPGIHDIGQVDLEVARFKIGKFVTNVTIKP